MRQTYRHMYRPLLERLYIRKRHRRTSRQTDGQISALRCSAICMPNWTAENAMDRKSQMPNNFRSNDFALSVYLPVRPFICLPVYIYDYLTICLPVSLPLNVCLLHCMAPWPTCLDSGLRSVYLSIVMSICRLFVYLNVCLVVCPLVCLSSFCYLGIYGCLSVFPCM